MKRKNTTNNEEFQIYEKKSAPLNNSFHNPIEKRSYGNNFQLTLRPPQKDSKSRIINEYEENWEIAKRAAQGDKSPNAEFGYFNHNKVKIDSNKLNFEQFNYFSSKPSSKKQLELGIYRQEETIKNSLTPIAINTKSKDIEQGPMTFSSIFTFKGESINKSQLTLSGHMGQKLAELGESISESEAFHPDDIDLKNHVHESDHALHINNNQNYIPGGGNKNRFAFPLNYVISHDKLNSVQESCLDLLFNTDQNCLITAPTGSGKTLLFEMAICRVISRNFSLNSNSYSNKKFKIIYLAPIKSLCQEKFFDWKVKYSRTPLDLNVVEATGDSEFINMNQLISAHIVLSTPERFDVITRKWKENPQLISSIVLLLIDEIHILNEEQRGATIEAIVARMKLLSSLSQFSNHELATYRTIALSATIPNIPEVAEFLQVPKEGLKIFGEEFRPVKVERLVFGYSCGKNQNEYMFEKYLDYRVADLIARYSEGRPSLVFCQTQKGTQNAAKQLVADYAKLNLFSNNNQAERSKLESLGNKLNNKQLGNVVRYGIAFHNAGLCMTDRQLIEENFKSGLIRIICTTSTLAQGVNLPARLVIIKSTNCYRGQKIGYTEYNKMEIDQMAGRAGRPQFDTKGIAIIMTEKENVEKFSELPSSFIESHLKENIVEHINAEISQGTIVDINSAVAWVKHTFLYVRLKNHPEKFGMKGASHEKGKHETQVPTDVLNADLQEMCKTIFKDLEEIDLIKIEQNSKAVPKPLCKKMSKNYVYYDTMKIITRMGISNSEEHIIETMSNSKEFMKYNSKMEDRKILNTFNKEEISVKYKVKGTIDTFNKKAFILIQAALGGLSIDQWELRRQQNEILASCSRILNCIKEFYKQNSDARGYMTSLLLKKSISQKMWGDSDQIMKQLPKIGDKLARNFARAGFTSFEKILKENPRKLEAICGKNAPFGNVLIDIIKSIPLISIKHEILKNYSNSYKLCLSVNLPWQKFKQEDFDPYTCYHIVLCENNSNKIFYKKKIKPNSYNKTLFLNVTSLHINSFPLSINFICDKFIGLDKTIILADVNDKQGTITQLNTTGQKTLFQVYGGKMLHGGDSNQTIESASEVQPIEIDEEIRNLIDDIAEADKKPNDMKKKKNKKQKKEPKRKKKIEDISEIDVNFPNNFDSADQRKNNTTNLNTVNIEHLLENMKNNQTALKSNKLSEESGISKNPNPKCLKISQIENFEKKMSGGQPHPSEKPCKSSDMLINLDFLDNWVSQNKQEETNFGRKPQESSKSSLKRTKNSTIFDYNDIL